MQETQCRCIVYAWKLLKFTQTHLEHKSFFFFFFFFFFCFFFFFFGVGGGGVGVVGGVVVGVKGVMVMMW